MPQDKDVLLQQLVFIDNEFDHQATVYISTPGPGVNGVFWWTGATEKPALALFGPNLSYNSGNNTLNVANLTTANLSDITTFGAQVVAAADSSALKTLMTMTGSDVTTALGFTPVSQAGARSAISLTTTGSGAASYNASTGVLNVPTPAAASRTFNNPSRTLNSAFQISTTRDAIVSYTVDISATLTLTGGATGTVTLEYADDSGFTTNVVSVQSSANGNTGALTIGLSLTQVSTASLAGVIPAGKYVRIRTANTAGTPSFTYRSSQEVLL